MNCYETSSCGGSRLASDRPVSVCCLETAALSFQDTLGYEDCAACTGMYCIGVSEVKVCVVYSYMYTYRK